MFINKLNIYSQNVIFFIKYNILSIKYNIIITKIIKTNKKMKLCLGLAIIKKRKLVFRLVKWSKIIRETKKKKSPKTFL